MTQQKETNTETETEINKQKDRFTCPQWILEKKGIDSIQHTKSQRNKTPMNIIQAIQNKARKSISFRGESKVTEPHKMHTE